MKKGKTPKAAGNEDWRESLARQLRETGHVVIVQGNEVYCKPIGRKESEAHGQ